MDFSSLKIGGWACTPYSIQYGRVMQTLHMKHTQTHVTEVSNMPTSAYGHFSEGCLYVEHVQRLHDSTYCMLWCS